MSPTSGWTDFYVIAGSSAGALIGLQFVVITLIAGTEVSASGAQASRTFATPTIVHLSSVLLLAAIMAAPWRSLGAPAWIWGILGLCGVIYGVLTFHRMRCSADLIPAFHTKLSMISASEEERGCRGASTARRRRWGR